MSAPRVEMNFPRPTKGVGALMIAVACGWLLFVIFDDLQPVFPWLAGDSDALFRGQVWRLITASLVHSAKEPTRPLFVLLLLYFFAPALEKSWGRNRLYLFLFGSAACAFLIEALAHQLMPSIALKQWYGGMLMADAAAVAWAINNRQQTVRLFFVIPIKPLWMVGLLVGWQFILVAILRTPNTEGALAPFVAVLCGWLFCDSGPGRRAYLKYKLRNLQGQVDKLSRNKRKSAAARAPHLRVIQGGASDDDDDKRTLH